MEHVGASAQNLGPQPGPSGPMPAYIEQGFIWIRETVTLIYAHHQHPLPMVALIFMYSETLGKALAGGSASTKDKVCSFVKTYLPKLWASFSWSGDRERILGDYYRNGLVHQMFMKQNAGIHEDKLDHTVYVLRDFGGMPYSINIDRLVPEFLDGVSVYRSRLETDGGFRQTFEAELPK